jgi:hypothetical protein
MWVGAWIGEVTLMSTIIAFLAWWVLGWSMVGRGPWSILIPNVWSMKEVRVQNHLPLWGPCSAGRGIGWKLWAMEQTIGLAGKELTLMRGLELVLCWVWRSYLRLHDSIPLLGVHIIGSVVGKLRETSDILAHRHGSLLQILELLLELDNTLRYMMRAESHLELILVDGVRFFMSFYICIPPISCRSYSW